MKFKELLENNKIDVVVRYTDNKVISKSDYHRYYENEARIEVENIFTLGRGELHKVWCIIDDTSNTVEEEPDKNKKVIKCLKVRKVSACSQCCRYNECPDARR